IPESASGRALNLRAVTPELGLAAETIAIPETQALTASTYDTFFQLDGNADTPAGSSGHDWSQVYSDFKKTTTNASGTQALNFFNDAVPFAVPGVTAQTEDAFTGGNSKDIYDISSWTYANSAPQTKADLENAIAAAYVDPNNNSHTYLYVA